MRKEVGHARSGDTSFFWTPTGVNVNFDDIYSITYIYNHIYININICKGTYGYKNVYIQIILWRWVYLHPIKKYNTYIHMYMSTNLAHEWEMKYEYWLPQKWMPNISSPSKCWRIPWHSSAIFSCQETGMRKCINDQSLKVRNLLGRSYIAHPGKLTWLAGKSPCSIGNQSSNVLGYFDKW